MLDISGSLLALTALLAYVNRKFIGLPPMIGVMGIALLLSAALLLMEALGFGMLRNMEASILKSINFSEVLMQGMLSVLLFAGAMHVDLSELKAYRWQVAALAVLGTTASMLIVGFGLWFLFPLAGMALPLSYCLLFGALIAPTDPIAVTGILKSAGAPESLEIVISGESLFNDGVGIVLFSLAAGMIGSDSAPSLSHGAALLLREAGGGIALGLVTGYAAYVLLKTLDSYHEEVLITLAAVIGGYALANRMHVSGPLAMVVVGLIIGNHGRQRAMSDQTRRSVDMFWELLDSIFNAALFVLIGLEAILISFTRERMLAGLGVIMLTLAARWLTVGVPIALLRQHAGLPQGAWQVLTWGGLRGGISVALALSLPSGTERDIVVTMTYIVVVFSILVQGLSIGRVVRRLVPCDK